jgi:hypothetical protein
VQEGQAAIQEMESEKNAPEGGAAAFMLLTGSNETPNPADLSSDLEGVMPCGYCQA